ncbi:MAG TPA: FtsX-like permease family protein [Gaiellales bacterium]|nr:FtsX-like permease family protein [Gaiellales bacterium]
MLAARTRPVRAPLRVALARIRARPGRGVLVAAGVALATAAAAGVAGGGTITADLELRRSLDALPPASRSFSATWLGAPPAGGYGEIDRTATEALAGIQPGEPARTVAYPELNLNGQLVSLGAVDDAGRWLHLVSGRLAERCVPARCEVVQTGGDRATVVSEQGLRLVVVGRAAGPLPFDLASLSAAAHGKTSTPPVLVAGSVHELSTLPVFSAIFRRYGWTVPIHSHDVHDWQIPGLLRRESAASQTLERAGGAFGFGAPDTALETAHSSAHVAARRLLLVGGGAAALLVGFVLLAAGGLRRDARAEFGRLERHGARAWQLRVQAAVEAAWVTGLGVVVGAAAATAAIALAAGRADLSAADALRHSLVTPAGLGLLVVVWLGATLMLVAVERVDAESTRLGPVHALDLLAVAAVAAALLAASRGSSTEASLEAGSDPLLALLPGLAAIAAGAIAARLAGPALRLAGRSVRRGPVAIRLALVSLGRQGGRPALVVAFVTAALGLSVFALSYRDTLQTGEADQAAFAVPLDFTVSAGTALVNPLDAAPLGSYRRLAPGAVAAPVIRMSAAVPGSGIPTQPALIGVPAATLPDLRWRSDYAGESQADLARGLRHGAEARLAGADLPPAATSVSLTTAGSGRPVAIQLAVERPTGTFGSIELGETGGGRVLTAPVPADDRGGRIVALQIGLRPADAQALAHAGIEGGLTIVAKGSLRIGELRAAGESLTGFAGWIAGGTAKRSRTGVVQYALDGRTDGLVRPAQPFDRAPLPVLASHDVADAAGPDGRLHLALPDGHSVVARVVAVGTRFPTAPDSFVVADERALSVAVNANAPGTAVPREVWIGTPPAAEHRVATALRGPPFSDLAVRSRSSLHSHAAARPLARGILVVLEAAAILSVVLAAAGLVLIAAADLADERPHLDDLEAMGVPPGTLRAHLLVRAAVLALAGAVGGVVLGAVLSAAVVDVVQLGAGTGAAVPPLRTAVPIGLVALALAAFALAALVPVAALAGRRMR